MKCSYRLVQRERSRIIFVVYVETLSSSNISLSPVAFNFRDKPLANEV